MPPKLQRYQHTLLVFLVAVLAAGLTLRWLLSELSKP